LLFVLLFYLSLHHCYLHSFPTRRSSDLSASSEYNSHYMLKDFDDKGYSEIEKVTAHGVIGSIVSPKVLDYPYATFEKTDPEELRSEEHTSELQSRFDLVCRLLLEKKNTT